jgi:AcrR family transcriptional regulator
VPYRSTERTEARRLAVRERIVAAAIDQVAEGGYASAGMQAVAGRADVAIGTVYRHFPSKGDLFAEVFGRASQRELSVLEEIAAPGPGAAPALERISACVEAFARRALAGPTLAYAQMAEPVDPAVETERLRLRRGYRDVFAGLLHEAVQAGEIGPLDTGSAAAGLVGAISESLVGPLAPATAGSRRRHEALIASLVQFCSNAVHPIPERKLDAAHR